MKENWIIGAGGNGMDEVIFRKVHGTREQVKKELLRLVLEKRHNTDEDYDYGVETLEQVEERENGQLHAYVCFAESFIDYEAVPENSLPVIELR